METLNQSAWLSGFADGDGCFTIRHEADKPSWGIAFQLVQRADHISVLEAVQAAFGGSLGTYLAGNGIQQHPLSKLTIAARQDILRLIHYFDHFPLWVKGPQYEVWREAALFYFRHSQGSGYASIPEWVGQAMMAYKLELERLKEYGALPADLNVVQEDAQLRLLCDSGEAGRRF